MQVIRLQTWKTVPLFTTSSQASCLLAVPQTCRLVTFAFTPSSLKTLPPDVLALLLHLSFCFSRNSVTFYSLPVLYLSQALTPPDTLYIY